MLKKLSLAALVAMGSMSFAGATDLSSAIQGVQLNGFLRVRAYYHDDDNSDAKGTNNTYKRWRTNAKLVFGVPVAESTKMVVRINAQEDYGTSRTGVESSTGDERVLKDSLFYVNYAKDGIGANVGVIPLGFLPYASSDSYSTAHGAGADATYTIGDVTLAAGYVDQLTNAKLGNGKGVVVDAQDIYTLGAIYKNKDLGSAQLWYATVAATLDYDAMLLTHINIPGGLGVNLDYAQSKLNSNIEANADDHAYYNIAVTAKVAGVNAIVGYAGTNDKPGVINTSADSKIGQIPGELRYNVANMTDADAIYLKIGYDVTKSANIYVAYNNISETPITKEAAAFVNTCGDNGDSNEYEIGAKYKVNKKFAISTYYDMLDMDANTATDQQEARVEFKYSF